MTGWTIRAGYSPDSSPTEIMAVIIAVTRAAIANPPPLDLPPLSAELEAEDDYEDHVVGYLGSGIHVRGDEGDRFVLLTASGGGGWRDRKEEIARAFCIYVMTELHRRGMNVSITCG